jgi:hypothetical protein
MSPYYKDMKYESGSFSPVKIINTKEPMMECPDCGEELVKGQLELEDGDWLVVWLCGCEAEGPEGEE